MERKKEIVANQATEEQIGKLDSDIGLVAVAAVEVSSVIQEHDIAMEIEKKIYSWERKIEIL